jgi:hypothetical protein
MKPGFIVLLLLLFFSSCQNARNCTCTYQAPSPNQYGYFRQNVVYRIQATSQGQAVNTCNAFITYLDTWQYVANGKWGCSL